MVVRYTDLNDEDEDVKDDSERVLGGSFVPLRRGIRKVFALRELSTGNDSLRQEVHQGVYHLLCNLADSLHTQREAHR